MTIKNAFRRGFTLIELMIVIVILGILMGTILPRLTGAQSRARDTARIADLNNISQALEIYSSDFGEYPPAACTNASGKTGCYNAYCLSADSDPASPAGDADTFNLLRGYMKGDRVPQNVGVKTDTLGCIGSYFYMPLTSGGTGGGSYVLASDLETWQMANYDTGEGANDPDTTEFVSTSEASKYIKSIVEQIAKPVTGDSEKNSIFIVIP